jgi:hypothetical protein
VLSNNLFGGHGSKVGGARVAFNPRNSATGANAYEAAVRIRDGERSSNPNVVSSGFGLLRPTRSVAALR